MMESAFRPRSDYKSAIDSSGGGGHQVDTQRPPVYNAEDYTGFLQKYCKLTGLQLYLHNGPGAGHSGQRPGEGGGGKTNKTKLLLGGKRTEKNDAASGLFDKHQIEMGLKQFTSISELLNKLKIDLHLSYHSFLKEFISEPNDGVTLLLDLLKVIQLSQTNISGTTQQQHNSNNNSSNNNNNQDIARLHQSVFKKALADEHECLLCLKLCAESEEGGLRLVDHPSGLFTVSVCVMSNFSKSRVLALQLLTKMCTIHQGHKQVSDAVSMLRLRFGEPVRFKFLIGMLNSFNSGAFQISCLRFLNTFVETAANIREKVYIQAELEDAGLDMTHLKKLVSKFGNQSDLLKEELNIWTRNYIDVNSLVTEKFMMQKALDKAKTDFESLMKKYQDLEQKHKKILTDYTATKAKCKSYEEFGSTGRWVEGAASETNSDQDSGKHSDTSLVNSSEECWAEIDKLNKSYNKRQNKGTLMDGSDTESRHRSKLVQTSQQTNLRNVMKNSEQRTGGAAGCSLTPTPAPSSTKIQESEAALNAGEVDGDAGVTNVVVVDDVGDGSSGSSSLIKDDVFDNDIYVERDALQEETVMVETQTIKINQTSPESLRHSVTRVSPSGTSYDDVPLPPSPRPVSKYRNRDKYNKKETVVDTSNSNTTTIVSQLTDDDSPTDLLKRQPRPPIRRRPRSKQITDRTERPKSAPPDKYDGHMFPHRGPAAAAGMNQFSQSSRRTDFSDDEGGSSETYFHNGKSEHYFDQGTLETVSAKSFGFIRPSQKLLEREQNKRLKRHKSFFNSDSLFGKKNSLIRRAESFHHQGSGGANSQEYYAMNGKYSSRNHGHQSRAKSVDRLLSAGDEACDDLDIKPLMKSKSMEFLKSKILRRPSKLQRKSPRNEAISSPSPAAALLGQSMFELHKSPHYSVSPAHTGRPRSRSRHYPDWPHANSSLLHQSSEFSKQDVRPGSGGTSERSSLPPTSYNGRHVVGSQNYDWRQDTPFWNYSRHKRKENVINWGLSDPPPTWIPPPPQRESMSPVPPVSTSRMYPGLVTVNQAVNVGMYLPPNTATHGYNNTTSGHDGHQDSMENSMLEITELEDEPLSSSSSSSQTRHHIQHPTTRILEMPSGLY